MKQLLNHLKSNYDLKNGEYVKGNIKVTLEPGQVKINVGKKTIRSNYDIALSQLTIWEGKND